MSMLTRARSLGRHRGKTPAQLRAGLDETICTGLAQQTLIAELAGQRTALEMQLDEAAVDLSGALEDLRKMTADRDRLQTELIDVRAELANATAVTVPPMERDTSDGADQATGPIDVRPLWDAHGIGPVTVVDNPNAVDPAAIRQTTWGRGADDTQPTPAAKGVA